jgi:hypothetical protein
MDYSIVKKIDISKAGLGRKIGQYVYFEKIDAIYFKAPYPFPVEIMISEGLSKCQVTPAFVKMPFILKGWINLDILLREIDVMKMALVGQLFLHASCVDDTLIVGFPNSGKTFQTMSMVHNGGKLISEEYTLVYNGVAKPYKPMTRTCISQSTIDVCRMKMSLKQKIHLFFTTLRAWLMPFMFEAVIWTNLQTCGKTAKVKRIVYGSTGREISNWKDLAILTENEFPFMSSDFLQAYALATGFDMIDVQNRQRKLIKEFCETVYMPSKPQ